MIFYKICTFMLKPKTICKSIFNTMKNMKNHRKKSAASDDHEYLARKMCARTYNKIVNNMPSSSSTCVHQCKRRPTQDVVQRVRHVKWWLSGPQDSPID